MDSEQSKLRMECLKLAAQDVARSSYTSAESVLERADAYYRWVAEGRLPHEKED